MIGIINDAIQARNQRAKNRAELIEKAALAVFPVLVQVAINKIAVDETITETIYDDVTHDAWEFGKGFAEAKRS